MLFPPPRLPHQVLRASADSVRECSSSGTICRCSAPGVHCKRNICLQAFARTSQSLSRHNPVRYCTWGPCGVQDRNVAQKKTPPQAPTWGPPAALRLSTPVWVGSMIVMKFTTIGSKQSPTKTIIIRYVQQTCVFPGARLPHS